jgi:hypothetical protein
MSSPKELCLELLQCDTEQDVIKTLEKSGYWDKPAAWRIYGDNENSYSTIGNQQSKSDAALVEKLVNSVDARLTNECLIAGLHPESPDAPQTIIEAVGRFFGGDDVNKQAAGQISTWPAAKRTEVARGITLAATGFLPRHGNPCFTIVDAGEGQTPERIPETLLSISKSNKLKIPFVQGKFNMGSTGALKFCGKHGIQLIITRRNPSLVIPQSGHFTDKQWGFTVVRREDPAEGRRSSLFSYLAPLNSDTSPRRGGVLRFEEDELALFPDGNQAYSRKAKWGTLVKLYEYAASGYSNTHILRKDGLMARLDLLLPEVALPIRLHECREGYRGHEGSFDTTLTGLRVRLEDDKSENLESECQSSSPLSVDGEELTASIFAFKKGKAANYRKSEGILFIVNGQTHGHLSKEFFTRQKAGRLGYISDSILVLVDCSKISGRAREDFFLNSRDRISGAAIRYSIERELELFLKNDDGLRKLKERRRQEEIENQLKDNKPLEEILESLLKKSPTLSKLFLLGERLSNPFKTTNVTSEPKPFEGKTHPTYFKFKDKKYGEVLNKECHCNMWFRATFETDVVSDYFQRAVNGGECEILQVAGDNETKVKNAVGPKLQNGVATLTVELPDGAKEHDTFDYVIRVNDPTLDRPFENRIHLKVKGPSEPHVPPRPGVRKNPPSKDAGQEREIPMGIALPNIIPVYEKDWETRGFDKYSALAVITDETSTKEGDKDVYDFYVNMDNMYLKTEEKSSGEPATLLASRFKYSLVLLGLALIHEDTKKTQDKSKEGEEGDDSTENTLESRISSFTRAIAPVLLPMISSLAALDPDEAESEHDGSAEDV